MSDPAPRPAERMHATQLGGLQPGTRVDGYLIECELGRGGMGVVYRAKHVALDKPVAIKIIPVNATTSTIAINRLKREGEMLARLRHPNILAVTDCGEVNGLPYLVLDYAEGGTVEDWIKGEGGKLPEHEVRAVLRDVLSGLKSAHEAGLVHRDIKPANLLLEKGGTIRISDFGLAQAFAGWGSAGAAGRGESTQTASTSTETLTLPHSSSSHTTTTVSFGGTLQYMAPELHSGAKGDARSDIYAVGVTAYYLLSGQKPGGKLKPVSKMTGRLHPSWDVFIGRCLEQVPQDRYQNAEAALKGLERVKLRSGSSRKRAWTVVASCSVAALATLSLFLYQRHDRQNGAPGQAASEVPGEPSTAPGASSRTTAGIDQNGRESNQLTPIRALVVGSLDEIPQGTELFFEGRLLGRKGDGPLMIDLPEAEAELSIAGPGLLTRKVHLLRAKDGTWSVPLEWVEHTVTLVGVPDGSDVTFDNKRLSPGTDKKLRGTVRHGLRKLAITAPFHRDFHADVRIEADMTYSPALAWSPVVTLQLPNHQELIFHQVRPAEYLYGSALDEAGRQSTDAERTKIATDTPFYLGETEITQGQYAAVIGSARRTDITIELNPSRSRARRNPNLPVEQVSYRDLTGEFGFIALLNREIKRQRLPFIADLPDDVEWEIGCRGGSTTSFHNNRDLTHTGSDPSLDAIAYYNKPPSIGEPTTVRSKEPNGFGLYDMEGNVAEIVRGKTQRPRKGGPGFGGDDLKIFARGGSWKTPAEQTRSASRFEVYRDRKSSDIGFRVVLRLVSSP